MIQLTSAVFASQNIHYDNVLECCQYKLLLNLGDVDINKTNLRFTDQYYTEFSMEASNLGHVMTTSGEEGTELMFKSLDKTGKWTMRIVFVEPQLTIAAAL